MAGCQTHCHRLRSTAAAAAAYAAARTGDVSRRMMVQMAGVMMI